jgi:tetratricopeptide (TPR) repeat protein
VETPDVGGPDEHIPPEDLALLAEGRAGADTDRWLQHLSRCRSCTAAYGDAVRYRAAWLAKPALFEGEGHDLIDDGTRVAARVSAQLKNSARKATPTKGWWPAAALTALAAVAIVILWPKPTGPTASPLPDALILALEEQAANGMVLPGGEAGAARDPIRYRGPEVVGAGPLRTAVDSCVRLYEAGRMSSHLAYVVGAGSMSLGQLDLARDYALEGLERDPKDLSLMLLAADIRLRSNDPAGAESLLRRALEERTNDPIVQLDLAIVLREQGRESDADRMLRVLAARGDHVAIADRARRMLDDTVMVRDSL